MNRKFLRGVIQNCSSFDILVAGDEGGKEVRRVVPPGMWSTRYLNDVDYVYLRAHDPYVANANPFRIYGERYRVVDMWKSHLQLENINALWASINFVLRIVGRLRERKLLDV